MKIIMDHLFLKFTHGVEIGASLAYKGHWERTKDTTILRIYQEEIDHQKMIVNILDQFGHKPFFLFDWFFLVIGNTVRFLCHISPKSLLNIVARVLEIFAIVSYSKLAKVYPAQSFTFLLMADIEGQHEEYFRKMEQ